MNNIKLIHLDLTEPAMKAILTVNEFNILCGYNGVGKTFMMINLWCLGNIVSSKDFRKESVQYIYDKSFDNPNFCGSLGIEYDSGSLMIDFDNGTVADVRAIGIDNIEAVPVTYMSSSMRLFTSISIYLKMRKLQTGTLEEIIDKMTSMYKLFDILHIERLISRCPITLTEELISTLVDNYQFKDEITTVNVDLEKGDFFTISRDDKKRYLSTYSNGEQALINMFIANI